VLTALWEQFRFLLPRWGDLVEIAIVGFLVYRILLLLQRTRAMQMILGAGLIVGIYFLAVLLQFQLIRTLLETLLQYAAIGFLVVFQPELRAALARLGQTRFVRMWVRMEDTRLVDSVVEAAEALSRTHTGAIIALEREVGLDDYARTGSPLQAQFSPQLIATIFTPNSPLHDGAVIVRGEMIRAAGAILPLSQTELEDRSLGTRHRAAIGLSEETDALVIVVSEETARISVAQGGKIELGVDASRLREILETARPGGREEREEGFQDDRFAQESSIV
jgi:diadenylate cyclase